MLSTSWKKVYSNIAVSFSLSILATPVAAVPIARNIYQAPQLPSSVPPKEFRSPPETILERPLADQVRQYPNPTFERFIKKIAAASQAEAAARMAVRSDPTSIEAHLDLAQALWGLERYQDAKETYQDAIQFDPVREDTYLAFGEFLRARNRQSERIDLYRAMVVALPESAIAYAQLADSLTYPAARNQSQGETAESAYRKAISLDPEQIDLYLGLGTHLADLNGAPWTGGVPDKEQLDEAEVVFREAIRLDPENLGIYQRLGVLAFLRGDTEAGVAAYQKAVEQFPNNLALYEHFGDYLSFWARRPNRAEALYREAIERGLISELIYVALGNAVLEQRRNLDREYIAAEAAYREALPLSEEGMAYTRLADFLSDVVNQPAEAILLLEQAIQRFPSDSFFYSALGNQLQNVGRTDEAIAIYRTALSLKGGSARALASLLVEQQRYAEALDIYERFVFTFRNDLKTIDYETVKTWESALRGLGRTAEADSLEADIKRDFAAYREIIYREVTTLSPKTASFHAKLGESLSQQDKVAEAEIAYRNALQLGYEPFRTNLRLGKALFDQGKFDLAEDAYQAALALYQQNTRIATEDKFNLYKYTGDLYLAIDRLPLALEFYQQALEISPNADSLAEKVAQLQETGNN